MIRTLIAVLLLASPAFAQGPIERAVVRGKLSAQERELLHRITSRLTWDKQIVGSSIRVEVMVDGTVTLRGSTIGEPAKQRALDLVENTIGVTSVVDELAVVKEVKVIQAKKDTRVVEIPSPDDAAEVVVPPRTKVIVPAESKVIVKP